MLPHSLCYNAGTPIIPKILTCTHKELNIFTHIQKLIVMWLMCFHTLCEWRSQADETANPGFACIRLGYVGDAQTITQGTRHNVPEVLSATCSFAGLGLKISTSTTHIILCGRRPALSRLNHVHTITIEDEEMASKLVIKVLGVHRDQYMTFTAHVDHTVSQMGVLITAISPVNGIRYFLT